MNSIKTILSSIKSEAVESMQAEAPQPSRFTPEQMRDMADWLKLEAQRRDQAKQPATADMCMRASLILRQSASDTEALADELTNIATANWRSWDIEVRTPEAFVEWSTSRARHTLDSLGLTPSPEQGAFQ